MDIQEEGNVNVKECEEPIEQMDYFDAGNRIPTLSQYKKEFNDSIQEMQTLLETLNVGSLSFEDDLDNSKVNLNQALEKIPSEKRLSEIGCLAIKHRVEEKLRKYRGGYKVIEKARDNMDNLKREQQKIYYVAAELDLPPISPEFKETEPANLFGLSSFKNVYILKRSKNRIYEKNTISKQYISSISSFEFAPNQKIIGGEPNGEKYLRPGDLLVNVSLNDSVNCEKNYEFLALETNKLIDLVEKFECVVDTLNDEYRRMGQTRNYVNPQSFCKCLVVGDCIYYEGNKEEVKLIMNTNITNEKITYRCIEMKYVQIKDLRVIFGHPYLYRHLGGCDHMVVFRDARLFRNNDAYHKDVIEKSLYPFPVYESRMKKKKCEACRFMFASLVSISDPLKNGENMYICQACHEQLHYEDNGKARSELIDIIPYIHQ